MKRKLVISNIQTFNEYGGEEAITRSLVEHLSKNNRVTYIGYPMGGLNPNIRTVYPFNNLSNLIPDVSLSKIRVRDSLIRRVLQRRPNLLVKRLNLSCDVLISNSPIDYVLATQKAGVNYKAVITVKHFPLPYPKPELYPKKLIKDKRFFMVAVNKRDQQYLAKNWGAKSAKLIHYGVDLPDYKKEKLDFIIKKFKADLSIGDKKVIFSIGRLQERQKGFSSTIKSLGMLKDDNVVYLIAGGGKDRRLYERLIKKLSLENKVKLLGPKYDEQKAALFKMADVILQPSKFESFGIVMIEAMGSGAVLLVSKNDGSMEVVKEGKNGFFIGPDPQKIAQKLDYVLRLPRDKLNKIRRNAKESAKLYSTKRMINSYNELLNKI